MRRTNGHLYGKLNPAAQQSTAVAEALAASDADSQRGAGEKRNGKDFALWKAAKPGEPFWPSPWGSGRPGKFPRRGDQHVSWKYRSTRSRVLQSICYVDHGSLSLMLQSSPDRCRVAEPDKLCWGSVGPD